MKYSMIAELNRLLSANEILDDTRTSYNVIGEFPAQMTSYAENVSIW